MQKSVDESSKLLATPERRDSRGSQGLLDMSDIITSTAGEEDDLETAPAFTPQDDLNEVATLSPADAVALASDLHGLAADFAGLAFTNKSKGGDAEAANPDRTSTTCYYE
mmetsp:Transcript_15159/g.32734  ORF Transcript_15159/g.32734 Transcript_15159/m.32734 type:complete len:110 (-) Transcript_15159:114-443(-)